MVWGSDRRPRNRPRPAQSFLAPCVSSHTAAADDRCRRPWAKCQDTPLLPDSLYRQITSTRMLTHGGSAMRRQLPLAAAASAGDSSIAVWREYDRAHALTLL